jgi:hypothetical protein
MFVYATCHLISHATGLFLLDSIERIGHDIILAPWRTPIGLSLLLAAFLTHLGLGLWALYRRRHLRMPAIEAWQLGLGLTIPLLLAPHVTDARLGVLLYGLEDSYFRVLYVFWVLDPLTNLSPSTCGCATGRGIAAMSAGSRPRLSPCRFSRSSASSMRAGIRCCAPPRCPAFRRLTVQVRRKAPRSLG